MSSKLRLAHDLGKKWRSEDVRLQEQADFSIMLLSDRVLSGLTKAGFKTPSPIQMEAIPMGRFGKDLLVQAKSGTGKTLVFTVLALEKLKPRLFRPQILILAPTREIATQVCSVIKTVGSAFRKLTCCSFIGGLPIGEDKENAMNCQIVVGTPGRVKQLIKFGSLPTNSIRLFVMDEADQLLQGTFKMELDDIFKTLPSDKQVVATSATYPARLRKVIFQYLKNPYVACLNSRELALLGIVHYTKLVESSLMPLLEYKNKLAALEQILTKIKFCQCLVFCNMISRVESLCRDIKQWGFSASYISSAKEQYDRLKVMHRFKHFKSKVLVSSDLTSRGIDAENVDLVVNFDLAITTETYLHRVGRAGRYGSIGLAMTIMTEKQILYLQKMESEGGFRSYRLPEPIPNDLISNPVFGEYTIEEPLEADFPESDTDILKSKDEDMSSICGSDAKANGLQSCKNSSIVNILDTATLENGTKKSCDEYHLGNDAEFIENEFRNGSEVTSVELLEICDKTSDLQNVQSNVEDTDIEYDSEAIKSYDSCSVASTKESGSLDFAHIVESVRSVQDKSCGVEHFDFDKDSENKFSDSSLDKNISMQILNKQEGTICYSTGKDEEVMENFKFDDDVSIELQNYVEAMNSEKEVNFPNSMNAYDKIEEECNEVKEGAHCEESNELKKDIENYIWKYEKAAPVEGEIEQSSLQKFQESSDNNSVVSADKIKILENKKRDYFYQVLKNYQNDMGYSSISIEDKNKQAKVGYKHEENATQNVVEESSCNLKNYVCEVSTESPHQSEISNKLDSLDLKDCHEFDSKSVVETADLKSELKNMPDLSQSIENDNKLDNIHTIDEPKLHSTPALKSKWVFKNVYSSEDSESKSESDSDFESVVSPCYSSESSDSELYSGSLSDTSETVNKVKRNAKMSTKCNGVLKKQHYCKSIAISQKKCDYDHSNHLDESKTHHQKSSGKYSNRGKSSYKQPANTCPGYATHKNVTNLHGLYSQNGPSFYVSPQQRMNGCGKYSKGERFSSSHRQNHVNMCSRYAIQYNSANPCRSHFVQNRPNYFVPSGKEHMFQFNCNCCRNLPHTTQLKPSHQQCTFCFQNKVSCTCEQRADLQTCIGHNSCNVSRNPYSLQSSCCVSYDQRNDHQVHNKYSSHHIPKNTHALCCATDMRSCASSGCQSHANYCHCFSQSSAACCNSMVNPNNIFYNQWRFLQGCMNPYL